MMARAALSNEWEMEHIKRKKKLKLAGTFFIFSGTNIIVLLLEISTIKITTLNICGDYFSPLLDLPQCIQQLQLQDNIKHNLLSYIQITEVYIFF